MPDDKLHWDKCSEHFYNKGQRFFLRKPPEKTILAMFYIVLLKVFELTASSAGLVTHME